MSDYMLNYYQYLKEQISKHFSLKEEGPHKKYRNLEPKSIKNILKTTQLRISSRKLAKRCESRHKFSKTERINH